MVAAFEHTGAAVTLVHHLKYRAFVTYARSTAQLLSELTHPAPLVPIPRAWSRRYKHGLDPAFEIARWLGRFWSEPVIDILSRPLHTQRRAGGDHDTPVSRFRVNGSVPKPVYVVDDVVTSGATVLEAIRAIGPRRVESVVAANVVPRVSSLSAT